MPNLDEAPTKVRDPNWAGDRAIAAESLQSMPDLLGEKLDHFELLDCIGAGGMGRVFRARDSRLERTVALKVLGPDLAQDEGTVRRFEQEAKAAARLNDPHFARVYAFGRDQGLEYIAMEYIEGENLRVKIDRTGRLDCHFVVNLGLQVARGLAHATECGVVHRDIKPSNIIITPGGTAKLVDMGLAKNFSKDSAPASELTQAGTTLGTFDYISPEQARDPRDADIRSDIYSLGCTLYHALTGRPPFPEGSGLQKLLQHHAEAIPNVRDFAPDLPEPVVDVLMKMMAKNLRDRYQNASELIRDLLALSSLLDIPIPYEDGYYGDISLSRSFLERQLVWLTPLLVFLAVVGIYGIANRGKEPEIPSRIELRTHDPIAGVSDRVNREASQIAISTLHQESPTTISTLASKEPREILVFEGDDLRALVASAVSGDVLVFQGTRYDISPDPNGASSRGIPIEKNLTFRSAFAEDLTSIHFHLEDSSAAETDLGLSLFTVHDAQVGFERVRFLIEGALQTDVTAIALNGGRLLLDECAFGTTGPATYHGNELSVDTDRWDVTSEIVAENCYFGGGKDCLSIRGTGDVKVRMSNCALRTYERPFHVEEPARVSFRLRHVSILVENGPVFDLWRLAGQSFEVDDSVFSRPEGDISAPLISVVTPEEDFSVLGTWWKGYDGNLFEGFDETLITVAGTALDSDLQEMEAWGFGELQPIFRSQNDGVWQYPDLQNTGDAQIEKNPVRHLRLSADLLGRHGPIGVNEGPWGPIYSPQELVLARRSETSVSVSNRTETLGTGSSNEPLASDLIVELDEGGGKKRGFRYLTHACGEAESGMTITLRTNETITESDIQIAGKDLTIRSAFESRPTLKLVPRNDGSTQRLFHLLGKSKLRLIGVSLLIEEAEDPFAESALLFDCSEQSHVHLQDLTVRIGEPSGMANHGLLDVHSGTEFLGPMPIQAEDPEPVLIELLRCLVRTKGYLLSAEPDAYWSLFLEDSFVVANQPLVNVMGFSGMSIGHQANSLQIQRSTILLKDSLVLVESEEENPEPPRQIDVQADECVFLGAGLASLTRSIGNHDARLQENAIGWQGTQNFIAGFPILFRFEGSNTETILTSRRWGAVEWLDYRGLSRDDFLFGDHEIPRIQEGSIWTMQPPTSEELQNIGMPEFLRSLGVSAYILPEEYNQ